MIRHMSEKTENPTPRATLLRKGSWLQLGKIRSMDWLRVELPIPGLPDVLRGTRILHLSDMHIHHTWMPAWDQIIESTRQNPPELICISGDFVENKADHRPALPAVHDFVNGLQARLGIFAILGNHDGELFPLRFFNERVHLLADDLVRLEDNGAAIEIFGIDGVHRDDWDAARAKEFPTKPANTVRIAMAHYPAQVNMMPGMEIDILFTGHTHGGQVCLPGGIPIITHDHLPKQMAKGVHRIDNTWMVVSRGLGFSGYSIRTFCAAEVVEVVVV